MKEKICPWVPMAKDATKLLPNDRAYTALEALFSLQLDHNSDRTVTMAGYSKLWGWTRKRTRTFFDRLGLEISYPEDTKKIQRQGGKLSPKQGPDKGQIRGQINFIHFNMLQDERDRSGARYGATTNKKENKRKKHSEDPKVRIFQNWWLEKYETRFKRKYLVSAWGKFGKQVQQLLAMPISFEDLQYLAIEFLFDKDPFIAGNNNGNGTGHNIGMLITRIGQNAYTKYLDPEFREDHAKHIISEEVENDTVEI